MLSSSYQMGCGIGKVMSATRVELTRIWGLEWYLRS